MADRTAHVLCAFALLALASGVVPAAGRAPVARIARTPRAPLRMAADHDILLRVARGEDAQRTPVWMMRQAGRYMKAFRAISTKYPFRQRSETPGTRRMARRQAARALPPRPAFGSRPRPRPLPLPALSRGADLAVELSLQPWQAFGVDGVIMFSDILTPLPGMGIDFDILPGKGPIIPEPIRSLDDVKRRVHPMADPDSSHPFIAEILGSLRRETEGKCTLIGFVGAPWTLAAYSIEGGSTKNCEHSKRIMYESPQTLDALLDSITESVIEYASYQIRSGAQVMQLFDSWGQHLSPDQFLRFAKPCAERVTRELQARHPDTPVIYFAHGSSGYLELQRDMSADMLSLDWRCDMRTARKVLGEDVKVAGNVDPLILFAPEQDIRAAVRECIDDAGGRGHILNLGMPARSRTRRKPRGRLTRARTRSRTRCPARAERPPVPCQATASCRARPRRTSQPLSTRRRST
jgi:uroporphyrinogen decarboxylase